MNKQEAFVLLEEMKAFFDKVDPHGNIELYFGVEQRDPEGYVVTVEEPTWEPEIFIRRAEWEAFVTSWEAFIAGKE